jgi:hypothetical protein
MMGWNDALAGQRAILVALAYPEPTPGKRTSLEFKEVNSGALSQARAIVKWCPEYVEDILAGIHVFSRGWLAKIERGRGNRFSQAGKLYAGYLREIALDKNRANEAEHIGAMPRCARADRGRSCEARAAGRSFPPAMIFFRGIPA